MDAVAGLPEGVDQRPGVGGPGGGPAHERVADVHVWSDCKPGRDEADHQRSLPARAKAVGGPGRDGESHGRVPDDHRVSLFPSGLE